MADLSTFARIVTKDTGLSIISTQRADGTIQTSLVNSGVIAHPVTGEQVVGFVALGGSRKLAHLRERPTITVTVRGGWEWCAAEGRAELIGPDDPADGVDAERLRVLLRTHDDWPTYDKVMAEERRTAVLVAPTRSYPSDGRRS